MKKLPANSLEGISQSDKYNFTPMSYSYLNSTTKRIMDIFGASLGIIVGFPAFFLAALIVKIVDRVPVIFFQERLGFQGKPFNFYKLRTLKMINERERIQIDRIQNKPQYETTVTGKIWRVTSIDEIIQFWLVLTGRMSLIGHRPIPMYYLQYLDQLEGMNKAKVDHYLSVISKYKPGMSSLSSVNGRGNLTMQQKMGYDLIYAQHATLRLDFNLLLRTILVVITRTGAK